MIFELHLRFELDVKGLRTMSERSNQIAAQFASLKDKQHQEHKAFNKKNQIVDEGFSRLRDELNRQLEAQAGDLNCEPAIGNILATDFTDSREAKITRTDLGAFLSVRYDADLRVVKIKCDGVTDYSYLIEVKPNTGGLNWYYVGGKRKTDTSNIGMEAERVADVVANKSLKALLGIG